MHVPTSLVRMRLYSQQQCVVISSSRTCVRVCVFESHSGGAAGPTWMLWGCDNTPCRAGCRAPLQSLGVVLLAILRCSHSPALFIVVTSHRANVWQPEPATVSTLAVRSCFPFVNLCFTQVLCLCHESSLLHCRALTSPDFAALFLRAPGRPDCIPVVGGVVVLLLSVKHAASDFELAAHFGPALPQLQYVVSSCNCLEPQ